MADLDASDDEDAVLLENPAYENFMLKGLKVWHCSHGPCALISMLKHKCLHDAFIDADATSKPSC